MVSLSLKKLVTCGVIRSFNFGGTSEHYTIVKVNISKIRKDHKPVEDVDVPVDPAALASADLSAKDACTATSKSTCRTDDFANTIVQHDASQTGPEGIQYGHYVWEPTTVGKIDFLEMFSQSAAMQGLRVGAPIDLRTG